MSKDPPVIVSIGDLHAGSKRAPCPPDFRDDDGDGVNLSKTGKWLWACWEHWCHEWLPSVLEGRPYVLVVGNDAVEGLHHRNGHERYFGDVSTDVKIAHLMLAPLAKKALKTLVVRGTECHVGNSEAKLGEMLGAVRDPETGSHSAFQWLLEVNGTLHSFQHHIGTTTRAALAFTALGVQLFEEQGQSARYSRPVPKVVCRQHRHVYGYAGDDTSVAIAGPAWQLKTWHGNKVAGSSVEGIGGFVLDHRGVEKGGIPRWRAKVYRPLPKEIVKA